MVRYEVDKDDYLFTTGNRAFSIFALCGFGRSNGHRP
jgi:hypothetical protein